MYFLNLKKCQCSGVESKLKVGGEGDASRLVRNLDMLKNIFFFGLWLCLSLQKKSEGTLK